MADGTLLRGALRLERSLVRRALLAGVAVTVSSVGLAATSAWLIVRAAERPVVLSLTVPMGLVQLFALAKAVSRYAERTETHRAALSVMGRLRAGVARLLEPLIPAGLGPRSADVVDGVLGDIERVQELLTAVAGPLASGAVAGVLAVVVSGLIVPWAGVLLLVGLVTSTVVLPLAAVRLGGATESKLAATRRDVLDLVAQVMRAGDEFALNGAGEHVMTRLADLEDRYDAQRRSAARVEHAVAGVTTLIGGASTLGAALLSAQALATGHLSRTLIAVPALLATASLDLVSAVAPALSRLRGDRAALERIEALVERPLPVSEPARTAETPGAHAGLSAQRVALDVGGHDLVVDLTTTLRPGDVVVVAGRSGSGKTSVARLLTKFVDPSSGTLRLGDTDYRHLTSRQVRERLGYVDDTPHVFNATLGQNLRIARARATSDEMRDALEAVGLDAWLASLPEGLETPLGGASAGLSGGEQRRLALARELLGARPHVVLDEPTEGLDAASAERVVATLRRRYRQGILVIVSHLVSQVEETRRLVVDEGVVREVPVRSTARG